MAYRDRIRLSDWASKQHRRLGAFSAGMRWRFIDKVRIRKRLVALAARGSIDSFEAAELLGLSHAAVVRAIDHMLGARALPQWCQPADRLGRRAFRLDPTGLMLLAMNLPGERPLQERTRVIELFNEMWSTTNHDHGRPKQGGARAARMVDETLG
jgi:hypothetical protein